VELNGFEDPEKRKILDLACGLDRLMILLLMETGLSIEELVKLRVQDVDLEKGIIRAGLDKTINLSVQAQAELSKYLMSRADQVCLFEGRCGKPLTLKWKRCVLEKILHHSTREKD
jgi:integrase